MGLDYEFITVIHKSKLSKFYDYIRKHGQLFSNDCACLHFEMDSLIYKFLEGGYGWDPHYDKEEVEKHIEPDGKASIGNVYLKERKLSQDEIELSFTAATTDMSLLFRDSFSISQWFVRLSSELNSILTYLDLEDNGVRIIYYNASSVHLEIRGKSHLGDFHMTFLNMMKDFSQRYSHFQE